MNYLIVDDEPIAHRIIEGYCAELPYMKKVGNAYNALEASTIVTQQDIDLIFLDFNMPKMTGFEWLKTLPIPPKIIVTTAYKEYALEGYELDIVDYLLKPFSLSRFLKAVNKANRPENVVIQNTSKKDTRIFLKSDKIYHRVYPEDILFIEAYGNYTKVYLKEKMILGHEKISTLESLLDENNFLRIHKSFIVSVDKVESIQGNLVYIQDYKISIGQTYRSRISNLIRRD